MPRDPRVTWGFYPPGSLVNCKTFYSLIFERVRAVSNHTTEARKRRVAVRSGSCGKLKLHFNFYSHLLFYRLLPSRILPVKRRELGHGRGKVQFFEWPVRKETVSLITEDSIV